MELSKYLKEKRKMANLSQGAVAEALGYSSPQFISNWERGISEPPVESLRKIALLYRIPIEEMFRTLLEFTIQRTRMEFKVRFYRKGKC